MVNTGKPSRGCHMCRARRIKVMFLSRCKNKNANAFSVMRQSHIAWDVRNPRENVQGIAITWRRSYEMPTDRRNRNKIGNRLNSGRLWTMSTTMEGEKTLESTLWTRTATITHRTMLLLKIEPSWQCLTSTMSSPWTWQLQYSTKPLAISCQVLSWSQRRVRWEAIWISCCLFWRSKTHRQLSATLSQQPHWPH